MHEQTTSRVHSTHPRWLFGVVAALVAMTSAALLYRFNPVEHAFYPKCVFRSVTGLDCPGCGGLRAAHQLLHGNVAAAFRLNPLAVALLPLALLASIYALFLRRRGATLAWQRPKVLWIFAASVIVFGLLRNLPWRTWLG